MLACLRRACQVVTRKESRLISGSVLSEASRIAGGENVGPADGYFRPGGDASGLTAVKPGSPEEIQDLVYLATESGIPIYTARTRYLSSSIRARDGLLLDLSRMDRIIDVDVRNMKARVEAGVTYEQLQRAADDAGLRVLLPISAMSRSVLRSNLDRDVLLGSSSFKRSSLSVFKAVLGNGEVWASGTQQLGREGRPDFGEDQGPQLSGAFSASEDIFGIPYQATIYLYPRHEAGKVLLFGFADRTGALDFTRLTARREHCFHCAAAEGAYWAALTGRDAAGCARNAALFAKWPWSVVVSLEHDERLVAFWEKAVAAEAAEHGGETVTGASLELAAEALEKPWYRWEYDSLSGDAHVVNYHCYPREAGGLFDTVEAELGAGDDFTVGRVVVPLAFGGSFFCETVAFVKPADFKGLTAPALSAYRAVFDEGALIDRPAGAVAELMFENADPGYKRMLALLKKQFDPHGILNPGALPVESPGEVAV